MNTDPKADLLERIEHDLIFRDFSRRSAELNHVTTLTKNQAKAKRNKRRKK